MNSQGVVYEHVHQWLEKLDATSPTTCTLEVGAGAGQYARFFSEGSYVSIDVPETWYQPVRLPSVYASADAIPFPDEGFDFIFSVAAFDYFPHPQACLEEFYRVLKPGGKCMIFTYDLATLMQIHKNCKNLKRQTRASTGHHIFDFGKLSGMADQAGFGIKLLSLYPKISLWRDLKLLVRPSNFRNYLLVRM